jgi:ribonuclease D
MPDSTRINREDSDALIDKPEELSELCDAIKDESLIAVDTEFNRTKTYRPQLCLIQIGSATRIDCVDVLALDQPGPLHHVLAEQPGLKVFHAAKQDLEALYLTYGFLPAPLFDTQIAAGLLGHPPQAGYATLVETLLGIKVDKGETRTDWSRRPLSDAQLKYAANDVLYLPQLYDALKSSLIAEDRLDWAMEDSALLMNKRLYESPPDDAWQRLASIRYLPVPVQARARRLAAWREARAIEIDRPRQWVLTDKSLLRISELDPQQEQELARCSELPPGIIKRQGRRIMAELSRANENVKNGNIEFEKETKPAPPDSTKLKQLAAIVKMTAEELGLSAETLATRKELTGLMRGKTDLRVLSGWRKPVIGESLQQAV